MMTRTFRTLFLAGLLSGVSVVAMAGTNPPSAAGPTSNSTEATGKTPPDQPYSGAQTPGAEAGSKMKSPGTVKPDGAMDNTGGGKGGADGSGGSGSGSGAK